MAKNPIQQIMNKPLSRKEFLQHIGVILLAAVGVSGIVNRLLHGEHNIAPSSTKTGSKWGNGKFGV